MNAIQINKHKALTPREARIESDSEKQKNSNDDDDLPALVEILISSKTALQLTVTKTSLHVLKELMKAYQEDITLLTELKMETDAPAPETYKPLFFLKNEVRSYYAIYLLTFQL